MIKKFTKTNAAIAFFAMITAFPTVTQAAVLYDQDAFFPGNGLPDVTIGTCPYWEEPAVQTEGYSGYSQHARDAYDATPNGDIDFYRVTDGNQAAVRVFVSKDTRFSYYGYMQAYDVNSNELSKEDAPYNAWKFVHVIYHDLNMDNAGFTSANRMFNTVHEWGHVLSLKHQESDSIMIEGKHTLQDPTATDYRNLNYMY